MDRGCIIVDNAVTGICTYMMERQMKECTTQDAMIKITPVSGPTSDNLGNSIDHKHRHGQLVENDVARCTESRGTDAGIGSVWIALLFGQVPLLAEIEIEM
ncbi:hypothetical protein KIN20_027552 [Parelaphostrongylus tenuis]|uniref:Uncharacterized protein n=1 Tax=Parelaphostrongylus tenuis TaxID=148309 RepID=A0AAD5QZH2_PARTN|nr:hypothetical protein KIN20_027552 [Parelaphostrongylus tenuis]